MASKMAFPIAAAIGADAASPAPVATLVGAVEQHRLDNRHLGAERQNRVRAPVNRRNLLCVPRHLLGERATHALQRGAFELVPEAVGIRDRAAVVRDEQAFHGHRAAVLIDVDVATIAIHPFV